MKTCKECSSPQFGGGYCRYHQYKRKMKGGDLYESKPKEKKQTALPKQSKRRERDLVYYKDHCKELTQEIKDANGGKIYCFFSGKEITGTVSYHHLRGRTGDYYTDKQYLVPVLNEPHLMYHRLTVEQLSKQPWFDEWMERLHIKDPESYRKELRKGEKTTPLNPSLFQDDEDIL